MTQHTNGRSRLINDHQLTLHSCRFPINYNGFFILTQHYITNQHNTTPFNSREESNTRPHKSTKYPRDAIQYNTPDTIRTEYTTACIHPTTLQYNALWHNAVLKDREQHNTHIQTQVNPIQTTRR